LGKCSLAHQYSSVAFQLLIWTFLIVEKLFLYWNMRSKYNQIRENTFSVLIISKKMLCGDTDWMTHLRSAQKLFSKRLFSIITM
jgi:hypothetical protein